MGRPVPSLTRVLVGGGAPYLCRSCGAPVGGAEDACSYCNTGRPGPARLVPEPDAGTWIEVTTLLDPEPVFIQG